MQAKKTGICRFFYIWDLEIKRRKRSGHFTLKGASTEIKLLFLFTIYSIASSALDVLYSNKIELLAVPGSNLLVMTHSTGCATDESSA